MSWSAHVNTCITVCLHVASCSMLVNSARGLLEWWQGLEGESPWTFPSLCLSSSFSKHWVCNCDNSLSGMRIGELGETRGIPMQFDFHVCSKRFLGLGGWLVGPVLVLGWSTGSGFVALLSLDTIGFTVAPELVSVLGYRHIS